MYQCSFGHWHSFQGCKQQYTIILVEGIIKKKLMCISDYAAQSLSFVLDRGFQNPHEI